MPHMSYCRFQNTLRDLRDCAENIEEPLSHDEHQARAAMIEVMADMLDLLGVTISYDEVREAKRGLSCGEAG